jgi:hypothetical protein
MSDTTSRWPLDTVATPDDDSTAAEPTTAEETR